MSIRKIISGGQAGVDQAALKAALAAGIEIGGWCPPNRECETGKIPAEFPLVPTDKARSNSAPDVPRSLRTELNVRDSDATSIITSSHLAPVDKGTEWTASCAARFGKPLLTVNACDDAAGDKIMAWIEKHGIETLNVAGPSKNTAPGIGARTFDIISRIALSTRNGTSPYDVAEYLRTPEEMAAYPDVCLEEADGDAAFIAKALGNVARTKGMSQAGRDAGLSHEIFTKHYIDFFGPSTPRPKIGTAAAEASVSTRPTGD